MSDQEEGGGEETDKGAEKTVQEGQLVAPSPAAPAADGVTGCDGAIVVVAKCPTAGKSKTRLQPLLGSDGAAKLAEAMLLDVVEAISGEARLKPVCKILLYAPATAESEGAMRSILEKSDLFDDGCGDWTFLPMNSAIDAQSSNPSKSLTSSHLGEQLTDALVRAREVIRRWNLATSEGGGGVDRSPVVFMGMDSPEVPLDELVAALSQPMPALLCPAADGGYGLLSVPAHAPANQVFRGVRWSHSLTAVSQIKALTDAGITVIIGRLMHDIDEPDDVRDLCNRLSKQKARCDQNGCSNPSNGDSCDDTLLQPSSVCTTIGPQTASCQHTLRALIELGQL